MRLAGTGSLGWSVAPAEEPGASCLITHHNVASDESERRERERERERGQEREKMGIVIRYNTGLQYLWFS